MEPLGGEVERELARFGPQGAISRLVEAWPGAVGPDIARNAWPARVQRDGTLVVHAKDAVWGFELGQRAAEISARLHDGALRARALIEAGKVRPVIHATFPLDRASDAHALMDTSAHIGKIVLTI